ncbi:MAG: hypothetical protein EXS36_01410 [Pedosphaera sp.]|nr:hypothetical protein [Pedosphaera sp.]
MPTADHSLPKRDFNSSTSKAALANCAEFDTRTPAASGVHPTVDPKVTTRSGDFGLRFQGVLDVPSEGDYTFWLNSDDGSQLFLDGSRLIDNDGEHGLAERSVKASLPAGPHSFTLLFFQNGGGYELDLQWAGPDLARQKVSSRAFSHFVRPLIPVGHTEFIVDTTKAVHGQESYSRLNCGACHAVTGVTASIQKPLLELARRCGRPLPRLPRSPNRFLRRSPWLKRWPG